MFCKHEWKLLSETVTKSKMEIVNEKGYGFTFPRLNHLSKKHIQVFTCDKCGKFKRFVEKI